MKPRAIKSLSFLLVTLTATALLVAASGTDPAPAVPAAVPVAGTVVDADPAWAENHYVGAKKCKNCHKAETGGAQYGHWEKSRHAQAFETLGTEAALAQAKEAGIGNPQEAEQCVRCHVTGYGEPEEAFARGFSAEQGVQCETCHGMGETHVKARFAAAVKAKGGEVEPPADGEIVTRPPATTCTGCHNKESPNFKGFCFKTFSKKIRHLDPRKELTDEQKAELEAECAHGEDCACDHAEDGSGCGP